MWPVIDFSALRGKRPITRIRFYERFPLRCGLRLVSSSVGIDMINLLPVQSGHAEEIVQNSDLGRQMGLRQVIPSSCYTYPAISA
jgi:hypothetical protein